MLLYLLFPAFILGVVGLPADNTTDGVHEKIVQLDRTLELLGNRTFNISLKDRNQLTELEGQLELQTNQTLNITTEGDGAIKSNNETSSLDKDQLVELEEKWVLPANQTLNGTTEDEGSIKSSGDPSTTTNYEDQLIELEEKLGLPTNHTMNITTEDDETFQEQEQYHHPTHCNEQMLVEYSHMICGEKFHQSMLSYSKQHWCDFNYIIGKVMRKDKGGGDDGNDDDDGVAERLGPYNKMTYCMEKLSGMLGCYYPNPSVQDFFLYIHSQYFYNCSEEELLLSDAPHSVVVVLTLLPVSLIPILVFLVIWKSKVVEAEACGDVSVEACQAFMCHSRRFFQRCLERENIACGVDEALWPDRNRRSTTGPKHISPAPYPMRSLPSPKPDVE